MYNLSEILEKRFPRSQEKIEFLENTLPKFDKEYTLQDRFYIKKLMIDPPACEFCGSIIHFCGSNLPKSCGSIECLKKVNTGKLGLGIKCPVQPDELKRLIETISVNGVVKKFDVSRPVVDRWCREYHIDPDQIRKNIHSIIIDSIKYLTPAEIANKYNIRISKVRSILKTNSIEFDTQFDRYAKDRLKSWQILSENIDLFSRLNLQEIAKTLNISYEYVKEFRVNYNLPITINSKPFSKEEKEFLAKLQYLDTNVGTRRYCVDNNRFEIDIFFPAANVGVEYNGSYFHDTFKIGDSKYHLKKTNYCRQLDIRLLHFWDFEVKHKFNIVESIISNLVSGPRRRLFARKCTIRRLSEIEARHFFDTNHLAGFIRAKLYYGLVYNDEIVQAISISQSRFKNESAHEIIRACSLLHTQVVGGLSKLLFHCIKENSIKKLITFADKRISDGHSYKAVGFTNVGDTPPNYMYQDKKGTNYSRHRFMKHKLVKQGFEAANTEFEIMKNLGYKQLHDCGSIKFELQIT